MHGKGTTKVDATPAAATLVAALRAGPVDEDVADDLGCQGDEVVSIGEVTVGTGREDAEIGFVDERGGVECLAGRFTRQSRRGDAAQFSVDLVEARRRVHDLPHFAGLDRSLFSF